MRRWSLVCLLAVGVIIAYIDRTNLGIALASTDFRFFFNLSDTERGLLNSVFFWTYTAMQIPAGLIVDRFGVRVPLAIGFVVWCIVAAATAGATTVGQLIALRLALGFSESIVWPGGFSWIRANIAEHERGLAVGIFVSGSKWGPAIGALLAARLLSEFGWREMFLILGAGGALWIIPWLIFSRESRDGVREGPRPTVSKDVPMAVLMKTPQMWGTLIGTFCYNYFLFYALTWLPAYFVENRQLSLNSMGVYQFFSFAGAAIVAILAGWGADQMIRHGFDAVGVRRWFTIAGMLLASTEIVGTLSSSNKVVLFFAVFSVTGLGLATANYWALTQTLMPGAGGRLAGIQNTSLNLAGIVAPIVTGWLKEASGGYTLPMQAIWVVLLVGIGAYMVLIRERVRIAEVEVPA